MSAFGNEFNRIRVRERVLLRIVAERSGVDIARISAIEQGRAVQTKEEFFALAQTFCNASDLNRLITAANADQFAGQFMDGSSIAEIAVRENLMPQIVEDYIREGLKGREPKKKT